MGLLSLPQTCLCVRSYVVFPEVEAAASKVMNRDRRGLKVNRVGGRAPNGRPCASGKGAVGALKPG